MADQLLKYYGELCKTDKQKQILNASRTLIDASLIHINNYPQLKCKVGNILDISVNELINKLHDLRQIIPEANIAYLPLFRAVRLLCLV